MSEPAPRISATALAKAFRDHRAFNEWNDAVIFYLSGYDDLIDQLRWRPISTAPQTGEKILLWWRTCKHPSVGWWALDEYYAGRAAEHFSPEEGWQCEGDEVIPRNQEDCTHWMPLPQPPTAPGKP